MPTIMSIIIFCLVSMIVGLLFALAGTLRNLRAEEYLSARNAERVYEYEQALKRQRTRLADIRDALDLPISSEPKNGQERENV